MAKPNFMGIVSDLYHRRRRRQARWRLHRYPPEPQGHLFCAHLPWKFANRHLPWGLSPFGHLPLDICRLDTFHFVKKPPEGEVLDYMGKTFEGDFCGTSWKSLTYIDTFYTKMTLWPRLTFLLPILREVPVEPTWLDLFYKKSRNRVEAQTS